MILEPPPTHWECPSCGATDTTTRGDAHTQMHPCPALAGLNVPLATVGTGARHVIVEREDYIGTEQAGRIMAVRTERADGSNDTTVYAPTATLSATTKE